MLWAGTAAHWEKGQDKLKALSPISSPSTPTMPTAQQLLASGETPVQIVLSMKRLLLISQAFRLPWRSERGACSGVDHRGHHERLEETDWRINSSTRLYDPEIQAEIAKLKKGSPAVLNAKLDPEIASFRASSPTAAQWKEQIKIDAKLRAEKTAEWANMVCRKHNE